MSRAAIAGLEKRIALTQLTEAYEKLEQRNASIRVLKTRCEALEAEVCRVVEKWRESPTRERFEALEALYKKELEVSARRLAEVDRLLGKVAEGQVAKDELEKIKSGLGSQTIFSLSWQRDEFKKQRNEAWNDIWKLRQQRAEARTVLEKEVEK